MTQTGAAEARHSRKPPAARRQLNTKFEAGKLTGEEKGPRWGMARVIFGGGVVGFWIEKRWKYTGKDGRCLVPVPRVEKNLKSGGYLLTLECKEKKTNPFQLGEDSNRIILLGRIRPPLIRVDALREWRISFPILGHLTPPIADARDQLFLYARNCPTSVGFRILAILVFHPD